MLLPFDTIERAVDFDERANDMSLRPWQWEFLLAADGRTRLTDLAHLCGIDFETAADLTRETEALGLVGIVTLSLDAYRASVAELVRPVIAATSTVLADESPAVGLSFAAPPEAPLPLAAPRKPVSVSFDSFSTMLDGWDTPEAVAPATHHEPFAQNGSVVFPDDIFSHEDFPVEPIAHESFPHEHEHAHEHAHEAAAGHDEFAESPLLDNMPIDFEFPDHMVPPGDRATHVSISTSDDSYADLFAEAPAADGVYRNGTTAHAEDAVFDAARAVDGAHAHAHAEPIGDERIEPAYTVTHVEAYEPPSQDEFAHDAFGHDAFVHESPSAPVGEHHDESGHEPFAPLQPIGAPVEPSTEAPIGAKKSVSFSLSADSFGLPNVPVNGMNFDSHSFEEPIESDATHDVVAHDEATTVVDSDFHEPVIVHEAASVPQARHEPAYVEPPVVVAPKKDDVLLQHFHVAGAPDSANGTNGSGSTAASDLRNEDLTGVFLRVLGLKK